MEKLRVAAYARVSTDKDDQTNSLISQRRYFADFINSHENWQLTKVYYDEGITGTNTKKRKGFNEMINDAMQGEFSLILTKEVCRFARNTVDTLAFTRQLKEKGVGVIFTIDNIDTRDSDGELRLTIMASIAQEESRKTSERVRWGQARQMEQGVVFGRDMLGYKVQDGKLSIIEEEANIVRAVFHKYTDEGKGTSVIARELLEEGMRPKRISLWSNVVVLRILRNEKYVGDLCQKKTITPDYLTHAKKYNRGEEKMIYIRDHHEPIISRELWDRTQKELARRSPSHDQIMKYSNRYWCSGKLYCGKCGRRYIPRTKKLRSGAVHKAWRCHNATVYGNEKLDADGKQVGCSNGQISDKALLSCMKYCISLVQVNKEGLKREILKEIEQIKIAPRKSIDQNQLKKQIDEYQEKKRKLIDLVLDGTLDKTEMQEQKEWYTEKITALEKRLQSAKEEESVIQKQINCMEQYAKAIDRIMDYDESNELLYRELLDKIVIYGNKRVIIWMKTIPFGIELEIQSIGRGKNFRTEVLETRYVEPEKREK